MDMGRKTNYEVIITQRLEADIYLYVNLDEWNGINGIKDCFSEDLLEEMQSADILNLEYSDHLPILVDFGDIYANKQ